MSDELRNNEAKLRADFTVDGVEDLTITVHKRNLSRKGLVALQETWDAGVFGGMIALGKASLPD